MMFVMHFITVMWSFMKKKLLISFILLFTLISLPNITCNASGPSHNIRVYEKYDNEKNELISNIVEKSQTTYYISAQGNDDNSGLSPLEPFMSLQHALDVADNNSTLLLKCNDSFYLEKGLTIKGKENIIISSYGAGRQPLICGLKSITANKISENLFSTPFNSDLGFILISNRLSMKRKTQSMMLNHEGEYIYNADNGNLFIYSSSELDSIEIQYAVPYHAISVRNSKNIIISDVEISFWGRHGVSIAENSSDVVVQNLYIHHIGGCVTAKGSKYGNGIECWLTKVSNVYIACNTVKNCFDAGITAQINDVANQGSENIYVYGNIISNCFYCFEYFNNNTENTNCKNLVVANNMLFSCNDITDGYREKSDHNFGAFFCTWSSCGTEDSILITNNVCQNSYENNITFAGNSHGKIRYINNYFTPAIKEHINKPNFFYGDSPKPNLKYPIF